MSATGSIFRRYAISLVLTIGALLTIAGGAMVSLTYSTTVERIAELRSAQAQLVRNQVQSLLNEIERNFAVIAAMPWSASGLSIDDRLTEYRQVINLLPAVLDVTLVDSTAREMLFASRAQPARNGTMSLTEPSLVASALKTGIAYSDVRFESGIPFPFILLAFPDRGSSHNVTLARISLQSLSDELARDSTGGGSSTYLLDRSGLLLAHSNRMKVLQGKASQEAPAVGEGLLNLVDRSADSGQFLSHRDGITLWNSWESLHSPHWILLVEEARSTVFRPVYTALWWSALFLLIGMLSALAISYWLARRMSRPVVELSKSAETFAAGQLDHRVSISSNDELSVVANSFNKMADELKTAYTGMEETIASKTAQLQTEFLRNEQEAKRVAALEERARIMRDIHDGLGGHLIGLLGVARRERVDVQQIQGMVQEALVDFRIAIDSLSPEDTDILTALANLRYRLTSRLDAAALTTKWMLHDMPEGLPISREVAFHVQRIVTEALTNVIKHAEAKAALVELVWDAKANRIVVSVCDDGRNAGWFAQANGPTEGRGLANMRKRAQLMGGEIEITSATVGEIEWGTVLRLILPIQGINLSHT